MFILLVQCGILYVYCIVVFDCGCWLFGECGFLLMGSGDWNDGMNCVGDQQCGESVWFGFFFYDMFCCFVVLVDVCGDVICVQWCQQQVESLCWNLEYYVWDGVWYCCVWFDNGVVLGLVENWECCIDLIFQSWLVLFGVVVLECVCQVLDLFYMYLVWKDVKLIQFFDLFFDKMMEDFGYICGYVLGVCENGGQYIYVVVWVVMVFV